MDAAADVERVEEDEEEAFRIAEARMPSVEAFAARVSERDAVEAIILSMWDFH